MYLIACGKINKDPYPETETTMETEETVPSEATPAPQNTVPPPASETDPFLVTEDD